MADGTMTTGPAAAASKTSPTTSSTASDWLADQGVDTAGLSARQIAMLADGGAALAAEGIDVSGMAPADLASLIDAAAAVQAAGYALEGANPAALVALADALGYLGENNISPAGLSGDATILLAQHHEHQTNVALLEANGIDTGGQTPAQVAEAAAALREDLALLAAHPPAPSGVPAAEAAAALREDLAYLAAQGVDTTGMPAGVVSSTAQQIEQQQRDYLAQNGVDTSEMGRDELGPAAQQIAQDQVIEEMRLGLESNGVDTSGLTAEQIRELAEQQAAEDLVASLGHDPSELTPEQIAQIVSDYADAQEYEQIVDAYINALGEPPPPGVSASDLLKEVDEKLAHDEASDYYRTVTGEAPPEGATAAQLVAAARQVERLAEAREAYEQRFGEPAPPDGTAEQLLGAIDRDDSAEEFEAVFGTPPPEDWSAADIDSHLATHAAVSDLYRSLYDEDPPAEAALDDLVDAVNDGVGALADEDEPGGPSDVSGEGGGGSDGDADGDEDVDTSGDADTPSDGDAPSNGDAPSDADPGSISADGPDIDAGLDADPDAEVPVVEESGSDEEGTESTAFAPVSRDVVAEVLPSEGRVYDPSILDLDDQPVVPRAEDPALLDLDVAQALDVNRSTGTSPTQEVREGFGPFGEHDPGVGPTPAEHGIGDRHPFEQDVQREDAFDPIGDKGINVSTNPIANIADPLTGAGNLAGIGGADGGGRDPDALGRGAGGFGDSPVEGIDPDQVRQETLAAQDVVAGHTGGSGSLGGFVSTTGSTGGGSGTTVAGGSTGTSGAGGGGTGDSGGTGGSGGTDGTGGTGGSGGGTGSNTGSGSSGAGEDDIVEFSVESIADGDDADGFSAEGTGHIDFGQADSPHAEPGSDYTPQDESGAWVPPASLQAFVTQYAVIQEQAMQGAAGAPDNNPMAETGGGLSFQQQYTAAQLEADRVNWGPDGAPVTSGGQVVPTSPSGDTINWGPDDVGGGGGPGPYQDTPDLTGPSLPPSTGGGGGGTGGGGASPTPAETAAPPDSDDVDSDEAGDGKAAGEDSGTVTVRGSTTVSVDPAHTVDDQVLVFDRGGSTEPTSGFRRDPSTSDGRDDAAIDDPGFGRGDDRTGVGSDPYEDRREEHAGGTPRGEDRDDRDEERTVRADDRYDRDDRLDPDEQSDTYDEPFAREDPLRTGEEDRDVEVARHADDDLDDAHDRGADDSTDLLDGG